MGFTNSMGRALISLLPADNEFVFRIGKRIVDRYNSENNCDMVTNGEFRLLKQLLPGASVVFDVGANTGQWTKEALKFNPKAEYHCFEPCAETYKALISNSFPANVTTNNFALGSSVGELPLFVSAGNSGGNSLYHRRGIETSSQQQEIVRIDTLDDYCERTGIHKIDFVKVDVEGHELCVLQGGSHMLAHGGIGIVQFEYGGTYIDARVLLKDVFEYVKGISPRYCFYKVYPSGLRFIPAYRQILETFQYSNWLIMNGLCKA